MIRWHHESLDGQGYPDRLPGAMVPVEAFVVKTADYWEAITSRRPYRDPMPLDVAAKTLRAEADRRIPGELVDTFLRAIENNPIALPTAEVTALRGVC
jgi:putative two-component system response regulator